jgi:DNA repair protein RadC
MQHQSIKNWNEDDRPREKMLLKSSNALSNAELVAILINNGTTNKSAVDVAKELMNVVDNNLENLAKLSVIDIVKLKVKGIGTAKAVAIVAALELGIRLATSTHKKQIISSSKDVALFLKPQLQHKTVEVFIVIFLNVANKIIAHEIVSEGGSMATIVDVRLIMKKALQHQARSIILCHNHPSGSNEPSKADIAITEKIIAAGKFLDIIVSDHIIISSEGYFSFADRELIRN